MLYEPNKKKKKEEVYLFIIVKRGEYIAPVGNTCQYFSAPRREDLKIWPKILLGNCLLEVQCPSIFLSILRNQRKSIDTFFPWVQKVKKKKKKRGAVRIP
jgi:hypothetical protein